MSTLFRVEPLSDPDLARMACVDITATIPEWFGQPAANQIYADGVGGCDCFAARDSDEVIGLLALRYHYERTAEIWWLGVKRRAHGNGAGRILVEAAVEHAQEAGRSQVVLETLAPEHPDPHYAATRAFYFAMGFQTLMPAGGSSGGHPMVWMILHLPQTT